MTRFKNKIGKVWNPRPGKTYSNRYMRILKKIERSGRIWIQNPKPIIFRPGPDNNRVGIYYDHSHDDLIFHDYINIDENGVLKFELSFMMLSHTGHMEPMYIELWGGVDDMVVGYGEQ